MSRIFNKVSKNFVRYLAGSASNASRYYILEKHTTDSGKEIYKIWVMKGVFFKKVAAGLYRVEETKLVILDNKLASIMKRIINAKTDEANSRNS